MESLLIYYLIIWGPLGYLLSFIGALTEGDIFWFIFAFLTGQGFYNLGLMVVLVFIGALIGDSALYFVGCKVSKKSHRLIDGTEKIARPFDGHLKNKLGRSLIISKFTYGVHKAIMIRAGMLHLPYKYFIKKDMVAILVWEIVIGALGYFSGIAFYAFKDYLRYLEVAVLLGVVFFLVIMKLVSNYSEKNL